MPDLHARNLIEIIGSVAKAIISGLAAGAVYIIGIIPEDGGFDDIITSGWLGMIPVIAAVYGITWAVPNRTR